MRNLYFSLSFVTSLALVSCSTVLNHLPGVYRLEVQQGNIVDQSMVDQLRPSMSKRQVLYIMGSPMVVDVFHQNRWDYIYSDQPSGENRVQKKISLFFRNDQLSGIQGDFRPGSQPMLKVVNEATVDVPKRDLEKTFWEQITSLFSFNDETKAVKETDAVKKDDSNAKPAETESTKTK
jgi:outer membrane protein assembly factor BamE